MRFISALIAFVLAVLAYLSGGQSDGYPGPRATYTPGPKPPLLQPTQPDASFKPDQAQALANSYDVQRDDANGALVYLFPNGGGWVIPYTPTPGAAVPGGPTTTPSATARPILATATPTTSATPPAATGATWSNPGFEAGSTGWLTYALAPGARWNLEDAEAGARLVEAGRYSLRVIRDEWSAQPPILHGGAMGRLTGLTPGQSITLSCRVFGVQGSTDPFLNNTIRTIYSQARLGFNAVGFGNTNDPQVLRGGAQTVWNSVGLDYQWSTVTVSGVAFAAQVPVFVEFQVGQEWSAFPFAAGVVDNCGVR